MITVKEKEELWELVRIIALAEEVEPYKPFSKENELLTNRILELFKKMEQK